MSVSLMKIIDEYAGRVIVYLISLFKSKKIISKSTPVKNILFIKFWGIGSIVLTAPSLSKVKAAYPYSKIYFLTLRNNLEICSEIRTINEIFTVDISNPFLFIFDFFRKIKVLRKFNFDIIFDFEFYTYFSAIIISILKTNRSFGFDNLKNNRNIIFTKNVLFNNRKHTKDNFLNLVNADEQVNSITPAYKGFKEINIITGNNIDEFKITVNPNASIMAYERRLPKESFVKIINHIIKEFKCKVILIGLKNEINYVENIYSRTDNKKYISNLCGKTSVKELITLIDSSVCLITNDSGPLHIASALNIPSIAFFGPESPERYGPLSERNLVFYKDLDCSPCMSISNLKTVNCIYDSPKCMELFEYKDMIKKIELFINEISENQQFRMKWHSQSLT